MINTCKDCCIYLDTSFHMICKRPIFSTLVSLLQISALLLWLRSKYCSKLNNIEIGPNALTITTMLMLKNSVREDFSYKSLCKTNYSSSWAPFWPKKE